MLFLFRSAPEVEKRIHSKLFHKFWRSRGTKEPAYITVSKLLHLAWPNPSCYHPAPTPTDEGWIHNRRSLLGCVLYIAHCIHPNKHTHTDVFIYRSFWCFFSSLNGYTQEICTSNVDVDVDMDMDVDVGAKFLSAEAVLILFLCPS